MSFKAKFKIGALELNVLSCAYALSQDVDATGRPSSITRGGTITMSVEGTDNTELYEWMVNSFDHKDGSITFFKRDSDAKLKEIKFKDAHLVEFGEGFTHEGSNPLSQQFTISAKEMTIGDATHVNEWVKN